MIRRRPSDEGASLVFALVIVTVFSVIIAAILTFAQASISNTIALRDQAQAAASADGAAQVAINALRRSTFDGTSSDCFGQGASATDTLTLPGFYPTSSGTTDSAVVTCAPDTPSAAASLINDKNTPRNAILVGPAGSTGNGAEDGFLANTSAGQDLKVHGSVFSNTSIEAARGSLTSNTTITARGTCTGTINASPARTCDIHGTVDPAGTDPAYAIAPATPVAQKYTQCVNGNVVVEFNPGLYTKTDDLNNVVRCTGAILHFNPGTYYFNFDEDAPWVIPDIYVVGGKATGTLKAGTPPKMPGSCVSPIPSTGPFTQPAADQGVRFVLAGTSRIEFVRSHVELCGSYSKTEAPVALYGLTANTNGLPAQSGCILKTPPATDGCPSLKVDSASDLYIQGTTYLPNGAVDIALGDQGAPAFNDGIVARTLTITPSPAAKLSVPVAAVADLPPTRHVVTLDVYVCAGANTCSASTGTRRLRAKIGLADPTGVAVSGAREVTVYSWAVQR